MPAKLPNYQTWKQDPKLLTKSTLDGGENMADRTKFLPGIAGAEATLDQQQQTQNNGYVSDFYRNRQQNPSSDGSNKVGMQFSGTQNVANG